MAGSVLKGSRKSSLSYTITMAPLFPGSEHNEHGLSQHPVSLNGPSQRLTRYVRHLVVNNGHLVRLALGVRLTQHRQHLFTRNAAIIAYAPTDKVLLQHPAVDLVTVRNEHPYP